MDGRPLKQHLTLALAFVAATITASAAADRAQAGQWALQASAPAIRSQLVTTTSSNATTLDIAQYRLGSQSPITQYTVEQTQLMHLILVRDDFREFVHVHPRFSSGHFAMPIALASGHRYYIYADTTPKGLSQQVFRFILGAGTQPRTQDTALSASSPTAMVGPYTVRLSSTRVRAHTPATLYAYIQRNGKPATDLHPYLGAAAHIVLVNTSTLTYAHVHPAEPGDAMDHMAMPAQKATSAVAARIPMQLPPLSAHAAYKLWIQFKGGSTVYAAPFTLVAGR